MIEREKIKQLVGEILSASIEERIEILKDLKGDREPHTKIGKEMHPVRGFMDAFITEYCREGKIPRESLGSVAVQAVVEEDPNTMWKIRIVKVKAEQSTAKTFVDLSRVSKTVYPAGVGATLIKKEAVAGLFEGKSLDIEYPMQKAEAEAAAKAFAEINLEVVSVKV